MEADSLRWSLLIIGSLVIVGLAIHGIWISRKNSDKKSKSHQSPRDQEYQPSGWQEDHDDFDEPFDNIEITADSDVQIANSSLLTDVAVKEKIRLPINRVNQALDISLKFPLLIINIVFLAYILIAKTSLYTKKDQIYDISHTQSAVIISPKGTHVKNLFDSITSKSTLNINELSKYLTDASTSGKSILFVSKYRQKIIIDCIRGNQLDSLYGDHVDKILSELKAIGCKL